MCIQRMAQNLVCAALLWSLVGMTTMLRNKLHQPTPNSRNVTSKTRKPMDVYHEAMDSYDRAENPQGPINVQLNIHVLSFDNLQETSMKYTMDFYFAQIWRDERMKLLPDQPEAVINIVGNNVENFWLPDTVFVNSKTSSFHSITINNRFLTVNLSDGMILYHSRITTTASCRLNLRDYPLDTQICYLAIESYGHDSRDLVFKWYLMNNGLETYDIFVYDTEMSNFDVKKAVKSYKKTAYHAANFSTATAEFHFYRRRQYFIMQVYLPCILIVMVTWVSFWINPSAIPARSGICVTSMLTLITMLGITNSNMPKVSYIKALDLYLFISFLFVFMALFEFILVLNCTSSKKKKCKKKQQQHTIALEPKKKRKIAEQNNLHYRYSYNLISRSKSLKQTCSEGVYQDENIFPKRKPSKYPQQDNQVIQIDLTSSDDEDVKVQTYNSRVDYVARLLFPISFIVFNILYWTYYLLRE